MNLPPFQTGWFDGTLPYVRLGEGPRRLIIFPGINDALQDAVAAVRKWRWFFRRWTQGRTIYLISRRRSLPQGHTTRDMASDYSRAVEKHLGPSDLLGLSMGGMVAQHFAADHPRLVQRLVLGVTAYRNSEEAREWLRGGAKLARDGEWAKLYAALSERVYTGSRQSIYAALPAALPHAVLPIPPDGNNYVVSSIACMEHDTYERLPEIGTPTRVIGAALDRFFPAPLVRETAARLPNAELVMLEDVGHGATEEAKEAFDRNVLEFLQA